MTDTTPPTDVLVVGAGPTGLTAALELKRHGASVRVIERRDHPSTRSKALTVHVRTLELFDLLGLTDELMQRGYPSPGADFSAVADKPLRANMYQLDTRYPFILIVPQSRTEAVLERRLNRLGVQIERSTTLQEIEETADHVGATVVTAEGQIQSIEAHYLIGADGAHSTVRSALGIAFEGSPYDWTAFLGDVRIDGHYAEGCLQLHSSARGPALIVPYEDGTHRVIAIDRAYQNQSRTSELELADLQDSLRGILHKPVTLAQPEWLARFGSELRLAGRYRSGRCFLAGDAAHTHSPVGGEGMNTGICDAFNLAWKLALAVKQRAPNGLLDTYGNERRPVGHQVMRTTDRLLRLLLLHARVLRGIRKAFMRTLLPLSPIQRRLMRNLAGLNITYSTGTGRRAGKRLPDAHLMDAKGAVVRVYERLRAPGYHLLLFMEPERLAQLERLLQHLTARRDERFHVHVLLRNGLPALHAGNADVLVDYKGEFETRLDSRSPHALLIRPDGYIAFDHPHIEAQALYRELSKWLVTAQRPAACATVG